MYRVKFVAGNGAVQTVKKTENLNEANDFRDTINAVLQGKAYVEQNGRRIETRRQIRRYKYDS